MRNGAVQEKWEEEEEVTAVTPKGGHPDGLQVSLCRAVASVSNDQGGRLPMAKVTGGRPQQKPPSAVDDPLVTTVATTRILWTQGRP